MNLFITILNMTHDLAKSGFVGQDVYEELREFINFKLSSYFGCGSSRQSEDESSNGNIATEAGKVLNSISVYVVKFFEKAL